MNFKSILFKEKEDFDISAKEPEFFSDLNLNIVVDEITAEKEIYNLKPFFYKKLDKEENISYRQDILKDVEKVEVFNCLKQFASSMLSVKDGLNIAEKMSCKYQKQRWLLDSAWLYCNTVIDLGSRLRNLPLDSEGMKSFARYVESYLKSQFFIDFHNYTKKLKDNLDSITYSIFIKENKIRVEKYKGEEDYGKEILKVFERFRQYEVDDYTAEFHETEYMNHVESGILKFVAKLNEDIFSDLENYCEEYKNFWDEIITRFDREIQFYISYLEYIETIKKEGLRFCYPEMSKNKNNIFDYCGFDIALAKKLAKEGKSAICNDFYLKSEERIFVVTGPNQGGKTTFARTFGQIHYLAALGLKVPGDRASLFLFDNIFTHFEKEEDIDTLSGKLESDLIRIKEILDKLTQDSIVIMNEIFSSTTLQDALFLAEHVLQKVISIDAICVFVTFLDKLTSLSPKIVSMTSTVSKEDVSIRTYKIIRKEADGVAYAVSIAEKYCLTYSCLSQKLSRKKR